MVCSRRWPPGEQRGSPPEADWGTRTHHGPNARRIPRIYMVSEFWNPLHEPRAFERRAHCRTRPKS
jgi:hypothetical protein